MLNLNVDVSFWCGFCGGEIAFGSPNRNSRSIDDGWIALQGDHPSQSAFRGRTVSLASAEDDRCRDPAAQHQVGGGVLRIRKSKHGRVALPCYSCVPPQHPKTPISNAARAHRAFLITPSLLLAGRVREDGKTVQVTAALLSLSRLKMRETECSYSFARNRHDVVISLIIIVAFFYRNIYLSESSTYLNNLTDVGDNVLLQLSRQTYFGRWLTLHMDHLLEIEPRCNGTGALAAPPAPVAPLDPPTATRGIVLHLGNNWNHLRASERDSPRSIMAFHPLLEVL